MKVMDTPRTGRIGNMVAFQSRFGQCFRERTIPHDPKTDAQALARMRFGSASRGWGLKLTEAQREQWVAAALNVASQPSLGQYSHLSGQQLEVKINSTLQCIGQAPVAEPPQPAVFSPSPVSALSIVNDPEAGVRLLLSVGTVADDIMVYGQPPCSPGRMKQRRVYYLGLMGPITDGQADITALYTARFGNPAPGQKVFIVTCQTRNGWKASESVFNAIVPPVPGSKRLSAHAPASRAKESQSPSKPVESPVTAASEAARAPEVQPSQALTPSTAPEPSKSNNTPSQPSSPVSPAMYKGSTPDARRKRSGQKCGHPLSILCTPLVHSLQLALGRLGLGAMEGSVMG